MTRKDYELIAAVFATVAEDALHDQVPASSTFTVLVSRLTERLAETNPAFNARRFREACGFGDYHYDC
jgi:hypothetical protein